MSRVKKEYVGAVDQGTTSTRFVIFNHRGEIAAMHQIEHKQIYPCAGWVEHDPLEIRDKMYIVIQETLKKSGITEDQLTAIGITNQRETAIVWNPKTGKPYYNAIVWQDTRTNQLCQELAIKGNADCYRPKVGLPLATYFSGPKIKWLLDQQPDLKKKAVNGEAIFGNIDTWLIWWLTGGPDGGVHITDVTNASRTMLMNLSTLNWDPDMLEVMGIPQVMLPEIRSSSEIYGLTKGNIFKKPIPVAGDLGDQQAALFGQTCFTKGEVKNTYGTGCFMLANTGHELVFSKYGLISTVAYKIGNASACYALEGSIAIAGALVQWFRDNFGLIKESKEIETLAQQVPDNGGIYFVPAFSGLFAPHWRSDARGLVIGMTHFINKSHIARAVLEATAFQTREIFEAMRKDAHIHYKSLKVDGGMVVNELLMQFQADILGYPVIRPKVTETTVLGAAYAAGLAVGFWKNQADLNANWTVEKEWHPIMSEAQREKLYQGWLKAVERSFNWI